jgi:hypothetical protein|eukprot:COSAG06_NODE_5030_length_3777_cov_4.431485_3_plen_77_part_00
MARSLFRVLGAPADGEDAAHGCGLGLLLRTEVPTYCLPTYLLRSNRAVLNADSIRFKDVGNVALRNAATTQFESQT